jgi:hypothetical protein
MTACFVRSSQKIGQFRFQIARIQAIHYLSKRGHGLNPTFFVTFLAMMGETDSSWQKKQTTYRTEIENGI